MTCALYSSCGKEIALAPIMADNVSIKVIDSELKSHSEISSILQSSTSIDEELTLSERITTALTRKSTLGLGFVKLNIFDLDEERYVNWETENIPDPYYAEFELDEDTKSLYPELNQQIAANPLRCCRVTLHGYSQPNINAPLYILITGRGMGQEWSDDDRWRFRITDINGTGLGRVGPHQYLESNCFGEKNDNWSGLLVYSYDVFNILNMYTYKMDATFSLGYSTNGFNHITVCDDSKKITYGTFE